jgi:hypothetical protein
MPLLVLPGTRASEMRIVDFCLLFGGLAGIAACSVYDVPASMRPPNEEDNTQGSTGGAPKIDDNRSTGSGGYAGASGNAGTAGTSSGAGNPAIVDAGGNQGGSAGAAGRGADAAGTGAGSGGSGGAAGAGGDTGRGGGGAGGNGGVGGAGSGGSAGRAGAGFDAGTASGGRGSIDAAVPPDGGAAGGNGMDSAGAVDAVAERGDGARETGGGDGAITAWLHTSGNRIYRGAAVFHGRGANFHDTRSCNACAYEPPNVAEVKRRADELIDNWKANFIRLNLESSAIADSRLHWQGVLDDPAYQADIQSIVSHISAKGAYVLLSLWDEPTATPNQLPSDATLAVWRKLADMFKNEPRVLYAITNEPHDDADETVWTAMNNAVAAIREVETQAGTPQHIIAVQGTQQWGRTLGYYVTHPITAGGGQNIAYETHVDDPESEFGALFEAPSQTLPVIIGKFGELSADALMERAEAAEIPYLAWTFHGRCPPTHLLVDNSAGGCGAGMDLVPTPFGQKLKNRLLTPW